MIGDSDMTKFRIAAFVTAAVAACASGSGPDVAATESGAITPASEGDKCNAPLYIKCHPLEPDEVSCTVKCGYLAYCPEYTYSELAYCEAHPGFTPCGTELSGRCGIDGGPCFPHDCVSGAPALAGSGS